MHLPSPREFGLANTTLDQALTEFARRGGGGEEQKTTGQRLQNWTRTSEGRECFGEIC